MLVILASESVGKIYVSMGARITSIDDLIGKATGLGEPRATERDGNPPDRLDRSVKTML
jgi:hypothetical protein